MEALTEDQKNQALFVTLVQQYQMQAWVNLGKLKNPMTDKIEKNLNLAKVIIDMLDMLKIKTKGNLGEEEARILNQTISDLKLSYVSATKESEETQNSGEEKSEKN
ncbi:MAG: DUF1844 domain-containing protein [Calditrichota bacterium]|jgi:hypothetical protein